MRIHSTPHRTARESSWEPEDYLRFIVGLMSRKHSLRTSVTSLRHHAEGIFLAEKLFGVAIVNSTGTQVPVRHVGEQHVKEDLGRIPTAQDWLLQIAPQRWMYGQHLDEETSITREARYERANGHAHENGGPMMVRRLP